MDTTYTTPYERDRDPILRELGSIELACELRSRLFGSIQNRRTEHVTSYAIAAEMELRLRHAHATRFTPFAINPEHACPECGTSTLHGDHCVIGEHGDSRWSLWDCSCRECRRLQSEGA